MGNGIHTFLENFFSFLVSFIDSIKRNYNEQLYRCNTYTSTRMICYAKSSIQHEISSFPKFIFPKRKKERKKLKSSARGKNGGNGRHDERYPNEDPWEAVSSIIPLGGGIRGGTIEISASRWSPVINRIVSDPLD